MSGGGGKGGESKQELDPEMKAMARELWNKGKRLSEIAPAPYTGITMAAPSAATKTAWTNTNKAANALGLGMAGDPSDGIQMEEVTHNGMTGYRPFTSYQTELQELWRQYPERMRALNGVMPGLMNQAKDWQPGQKYGEPLPEQPQTPQWPNGPYRPGMPYDYSQIAAMYNNRGMGR